MNLNELRERLEQYKLNPVEVEVLKLAIETDQAVEDAEKLVRGATEDLFLSATSIGLERNSCISVDADRALVNSKILLERQNQLDKLVFIVTMILANYMGFNRLPGDQVFFSTSVKWKDVFPLCSEVWTNDTAILVGTLATVVQWELDNTPQDRLFDYQVKLRDPISDKGSGGEMRDLWWVKEEWLK